MRNIVKKLFTRLIISLGFSIFIYSVYKDFLVFMLLLFFLVVLISLEPSFIIINKLVKKTNWYNNRIGGTLKFCRKINQDLDICNLGSTSGKYAFEYENTGLKGENWALSPQTLAYDFRILKNYFSYLKEGAVVLIPICPFSGCIIDFEEDGYNKKYYSFLHPILILNYSSEVKNRIMKLVNTPLKVNPIKSIIRLIIDSKDERDSVMNKQKMEENADLLIDSWKNQFLLSNLDDSVPEKLKMNMEYNVQLLEQLNEFCVERKLRPVIVLPPMTPVLSSKFSETFRHNYVYYFVEKIEKKGVKFLNYMDDVEFINIELFFNSYYLNKKGSKIFTKRVLRDLGLIEGDMR